MRERPSDDWGHLVGRAGYAQRAKEELFRDGKVSLPLSIASLALGIPMERLKKLPERGGLLIRLDGEMVVFELKPDVQEITRNLWQEMVASFQRCRSDASRVKNDYLDKATELQTKLQKGGVGSDEAMVYEIHLQSLWPLIPPKTQDELRASKLSPQFIRSNLGIAGSEV